MKRIVYVFVAVVIFFLISVIYRDRMMPLLVNFPVDELRENSKDDVLLNLVLFFSRKNCPPCVQQVIDCLNQLPKNVRVVGIIKNEELNYLDEIRALTGAKFPIKSMKKWNKFRPNYAPTLYGIGPDGKVCFILACTGLEENYLRDYIDEFIRKAEHLLRQPN